MSFLLLLDSDEEVVDGEFNALVSRYRKLLQDLLPHGQAWTRDEDANLTKLLEAISCELGRIHERREALLLEVNPATTDELLPEWEELFGLPDSCTPIAGGTAARRQAITTKWVSKRGQSFDDFQSLATSLGYGAITITGYDAFRVGLSAVGDALTNDPWVFAKVVTVDTGDDDAQLTCVFRRHVHAHGWLDFEFT